MPAKPTPVTKEQFIDAVNRHRAIYGVYTELKIGITRAERLAEEWGVDLSKFDDPQPTWEQIVDALKRRGTIHGAMKELKISHRMLVKLTHQYRIDVNVIIGKNLSAFCLNKRGRMG